MNFTKKKKLFFKKKGIEKDLDKSIEYHVIAANKGFKDSVLSLIELDPQNKKINLDGALKIFEQKMKNKNNKKKASAYKYTALLYLNGLGVEKDAQKALKYFLTSVDLGEITGYNSLGVIYQQGRG